MCTTIKLPTEYREKGIYKVFQELNISNASFFYNSDIFI